MSTETTEQTITLEELFRKLDEQLKDGKIPKELSFKEAINMLQSYNKEMQEKLEFATKLKKDNKNLLGLYYDFAGYNASKLIDNLRGLGFSLRKNKQLKEAFEKAGYRLLEQTRAAKRDDIYYGILRIFISTQREFPKNLSL